MERTEQVSQRPLRKTAARDMRLGIKDSTMEPITKRVNGMTKNTFYSLRGC